MEIQGSDKYDVTQAVITRAEWGARTAKSRKALNDTTSPTIHWNGPGTGLDEDDDMDAEIKYLKSVQRWHMDNNGWADIAYNFAFAPSGRVYECRGWKIRSAANGTNAGNSASHAFLLMIGEGDEISQKMIDSVRRMRAIGDSKYVKAHRDWKATACPGPEITKLIRKGAFEGLPEGDKTPEPLAPIDVPAEPVVEVKVVRPDTGPARLKLKAIGESVVALQRQMEELGSYINDIDNFQG